MWGLGFVAVVAGLILWGWAWWYRSERLLRRYSARTHFSVGRYIVGLEDQNHVTDNVECVVGPHDFVFAKMGGAPLGRIPRDAVEEVTIDDKSQIVQRLTVTRMVALGVFSLAAPKKRKIRSGAWESAGRTVRVSRESRSLSLPDQIQRVMQTKPRRNS